MFLGAFQQVLMAIATRSLPQFLMAATLAALVFNDAVYTSHVVEGEKTVVYRLELMLIDLLNFCLLAAAIVTVNPKTNVFSVDLSGRASWLTEGVFWFVLAVYRLSIMFWTWCAGKYSGGYPARLLVASGLVSVVFIVEAGVASAQLGAAADWGRGAALAYFLCYVGLIRPVWLRAWAA